MKLVMIQKILLKPNLVLHGFNPNNVKIPGDWRLRKNDCEFESGLCSNPWSQNTIFPEMLYISLT